MPVGTTQGLITRCPDCATAFRATAEQLWAREGQVRCGRCGRVFNAIENALAVAPSTPPRDEVIAEATPGPATSTGEGRHADAPVENSAGLISATTAHDADRPDSTHEIDARPSTGDRPSEDETASITAVPDSVADPEVPASLRPDAIRAEAPSPPPDLAHVQTTKKTAATATVEPLAWEFGRPKRPANLVSRWVGVPGVLVLFGVLLGQMGYHLRGDLVLLFPFIRPAAEQACEWVGCDLPPPKRAELMSIESSELQADSTNPAVMVLSATLRNRAPFPQAPPALELTLTDSQDQPLARRVLSANDYSVRGVQNNLFPASSELPIKVYFEASTVKATGYRLYLFFP